MLIGNGIPPILWRPSRTPPRPLASLSPDTFQASQNEFRPPSRADMMKLMSQPTGKGVGIFVADMPGHGDEVESVVENGAGGAPRTRADFTRDAFHRMQIPANATLESCAGEVDKALAAPFEAARKMLDRVSTERVVNMSFGLPIEALYHELAQKLGKDPAQDGAQIVQFVLGRLETAGAPGNQAREAYRKKVEELAQKGVTVVVAAGNGKADDPISKAWAKHDQSALRNLLADPGSKVLAVGATDNQGRPSPISAPSSPDLAAPSIPPKKGGMPGTSFAAPYVAATIALMLEVNPRLTHSRIREILIAASQTNGQDPRYVGAGMLNREKALQMARESA